MTELKINGVVYGVVNSNNIFVTQRPFINLWSYGIPSQFMNTLESMKVHKIILLISRGDYILKCVTMLSILQRYGTISRGESYINYICLPTEKWGQTVLTKWIEKPRKN